MTRFSCFTIALVLVTAFAAPAAAQYCIPVVGTASACGFDEYIANVTITDAVPTTLLNNGSACVFGYEDYSTSVAPIALAIGPVYNISVTISNYWNGDSILVFIDADQNLSLDDLGETVCTIIPTAAGSGGSPLTVTGTFSVPATAVNGATRLRVRLDYFGPYVTPACGTASFGNVEDYTAVIGGGGGPEFMVNQAGSSLDLDGVIGGPFVPAVTTKCVNTFGVANFASGVGPTVFECGLTFGPLVSASGGGINLGGGEILNLNLADPSLFFLNGGAAVSLLPFPGNFSGTFNTGPAAATVSIQMLNAGVGTPGGYDFSQGCQLNIVLGGTLAGPVGDDVGLQVNFGTGVLQCGPAAVNFYGTTYTSAFAQTNGRWTFNTNDASYSPSTAAAMTGVPFIGNWTDYNTNTAGSINIAATPTGYNLNYVGIGYFGNTAANISTFTVGLTNSSTCNIAITNMAAGSGQAMLGLSPGTAATDPGQALFSPAGFGTTLNSTDMLYNIGTQGSLAPGITSIVFGLNAFNNYDFSSS